MSDTEDTGKELVAIARNPAEMQVAQRQLVVWASNKLTTLTAEKKDIEENLEIARKRKWRLVPFARQVTKVQKQIEFYTKVHAALEAGYVIVPNFQDIDIFAIRTTHKKPKANVAVSERWPDTPRDQESNRPALGEGAYVNAQTKNMSERVKHGEDKEGQEIVKLHTWAKDFTDVDFPFTFAKPVILEATAEAMMLKCFDDLGILPNRNLRRGQDPMVVGRIWTQSNRHNRKTISFLIAWFVDTKDL